MFSTFINAFKIKDLRKKILYTILLIVVYRLGSAIPIPGVNLVAWGQATERLSAMSDFMSLMSGSAFSQFTIFAMGISPYITASIILQLLTIAIPALEKMSKEEDGRQKIERITRYAGVGLAVVQAIGIVLSYNNALGTGGSIVSGTGWTFVLRLGIIAICAAAGTAFLMWLGERITEKGIGNGISMLIFASIVSRVPDFIKERINAIAANPGSVWTWVVLVLTIVVILALIGFVVYIDKAVRKIPVQYAKRVVGRKMYGGQNTHLPLKANANGVLDVLAAAGSEYAVANLVEAAIADRVAVAEWLVGHGVDVNGNGVMAAAFGKPDDDDTATYKYLVSQGGLALKRTPKCCKELRAKLAEAEKNRAAKDGGKAKVSGTFSFETDNVK